MSTYIVIGETTYGLDTDADHAAAVRALHESGEPHVPVWTSPHPVAWIREHGDPDGYKSGMHLYGEHYDHAPEPDASGPGLADKLERIAELLETARAIVAELECGETVETETDADHAISEACDLARRLIGEGKAK
jgi:hypothetical protein